MTEKRQDQDPYAHALEMAEQRRQWEQDRKAQAEQREREQKQRELESYLRRRGSDFMDHTGQQPTHADLERWQQQYLDEREQRREAERAAKLAEVEENYR